jgi:hypothetical protein
MSLTRRAAIAAAALAVLSAGVAVAATPTPAAASQHKPHYLPTIGNQAAFRNGLSPLSPGITPPAPPCPVPVTDVPSVDTGVIGSTPSRVGPCIAAPEAVATGEPFVGNMAYWGGRVQVHPHIYLVYFGWDRPGAFAADCSPSKLDEGAITAQLGCDPDGAGKQMADFVSQLGGTPWAGVQSQYYQVVNGVQTNISNDRNQLAGIWVDDAHAVTPKISYRDMATEAERAVKHFHIADKDLTDSNIVIAQPQKFSDPKAQSTGYCAFHDMVEPSLDPEDYKGLTPGVAWTNMPYVLNQGTSCGEHSVNSSLVGRLDGFTLALGHEIEETVTDPGAEDHVNGASLGGWYDPFDGNENGDKCAYVGQNTSFSPITEPGAAANIRGNRGGSFAVQSLWSNSAAAGVGYCAGTGNDLPI